MSVTIGEVETFRDVRPNKEQALKVVEEAAEVFSAWERQSREVQRALTTGADIDPTTKAEVLDECADVIQATCNLIAAFSVEDFTGAMRECTERNRRRGRM